MSTKFIQRGDSIGYTPGAAVSAGDVVVQGELVGVAKLDIAAGKLGALAVSGVFEFPKATTSASALAAGTKVYWDAGSEIVTPSAGGGANKYVGKVIRAAAADAAVVWVRLEQ